MTQNMGVLDVITLAKALPIAYKLVPGDRTPMVHLLGISWATVILTNPAKRALMIRTVNKRPTKDSNLFMMSSSFSKKILLNFLPSEILSYFWFSWKSNPFLATQPESC